MLAAALLAGAPAGGDPLPRIGIIDFYGLRQVPEASVRRRLGIAVGDSVSPSLRDSATARLRAVPGVTGVRLAPVCCEAGRLILYVGVEEAGAPQLRFRGAPTGTVRLPDDVVRASEVFEAAFDSALAHGDFAEDDTAGHQLMHYPAARQAQEQFVPLARRYADSLRSVLRQSGDGDERALAARILAYVPRKQDVVADLVFAMSDPDEDVRNNAMRALAVIALLARRRPELQLQVPLTPFVDLLNSPVWTDRNKASFALLSLSESRDPALFALLRKQAMPALAEMARWQSRGHAVSAAIILGRLGGLTEPEIHDAWDRGDRQRLIDAALKAK
jgi:hypothetical protein